MIAKHDADLALEMLAQTRSAKLTEELAKATQPNAKQDDGGYLNFNPEQYRVRQEIALEQQVLPCLPPNKIPIKPSN